MSKKLNIIIKEVALEVINIKNKTRKLLANNIIYFRHKNNWSQEMLAEKMKSSPAYISQLENVTSDFFDKIADTFKIEPYQLLIERDVVNYKRVDQKK